MKKKSVLISGLLAATVVLLASCNPPRPHWPDQNLNFVDVPPPGTVAPLLAWTKLEVPTRPLVGWSSLDLAPDGKTLAARSTTGETFSSVDGGQSWFANEVVGRRFHTEITSPSKMALVRSAWDSGTEVSTDGGLSWTPVTVADFRFLLAISDAGHLWLESRDRGIRVTSDFGASWRAVSPPKGFPGERSQRVNLAADGTAYYSVFLGALDTVTRVWTSSDEGVNWVPVTLPVGEKYRDFVVAADDNLFVTVDGHLCYRSVDKGASWAALASPVGTDPYTLRFSRDGGKVLLSRKAMGSIPSFLSLDGGTSWLALPAAGAGALVCLGDVGSPDVMAYSNDPDLLLSSDGFATSTRIAMPSGRSWSGLTAEGEGQALTLTLFDDSTALVSRSGGQSWAKAPLPVGQSPPRYRKAFGEPRIWTPSGDHALGTKVLETYTIVGTDIYWGLNVTHDHGASFETLARWEGDQDTWTILVDGAVSGGGNRIYLRWDGLTANGFFVSEDGGQSWWKPEGEVEHVDASTSGDMAVVSLPNGGLRTSADGGRSWTDQSALTERLRGVAMTREGTSVFALTQSGLWMGQY